MGFHSSQWAGLVGLLGFLRQKLWGVSHVGWDCRVCNHFPTLIHADVNTFKAQCYLADWFGDLCEGVCHVMNGGKSLWLKVALMQDSSIWLASCMVCIKESMGVSYMCSVYVLRTLWCSTWRNYHDCAMCTYCMTGNDLCDKVTCTVCMLHALWWPVQLSYMSGVCMFQCSKWSVPRKMEETSHSASTKTWSRCLQKRCVGSFACIQILQRNTVSFHLSFLAYRENFLLLLNSRCQMLRSVCHLIGCCLKK